ncbi:MULTISPECIES: RNA polymerase sigma factor [Pseudomonas]|nr:MULTISPECIES: RNA polymerase sigma factor [Pseudomonas]MDD1014958.1 RNA polymerase sigma factor [Pseudomonas rubra]MDD1038079.1 RNA polymerase sigma factor [Pseudomonas rubra]MDD1156592.1 RNA polymerase sigma factor [Pseudomonas rubra]
MSRDREHLLATFMENREALQAYLVRQFGNANVAEDLAQETWLRVASRKLGEQIGNPRAYIFRIARNLGMDLRRREALGIEVQADPVVVELVADARVDPLREAEMSRELQRLMQVVAELPARCREVFLLCRVEGLDHQQVAERLNISKSTVVSQMVKAMQRIEKAMQ